MADNVDDSLCNSSCEVVDNTHDVLLTYEFPIDYWNAEAQQGTEELNNLDVGVPDSFMDHSVMLELPKFSKGFQASDFNELVRKYVGEENLTRLKKGKYPNLWIMEVKTIEIRENLLRIWKTKIKNKTCWINPYHSYELRGFLYWLPNFISDDDVKTQLSQFGDVLLLEKEVHNRWKGKIQSEVRYFGLRLRDGMVKNDMPHFLKFEGYRTLVIVRGRKPACFHCKEFGHSKKDCKKYKEKINDYCGSPKVGKPRIKPRGRRHRPASDVQMDSQDGKHKDETKSTSKSVLTKECSSHTSDLSLSITTQKSEILTVLQSLKLWKEETTEMVEQTLEHTEKNLMTTLSQIEIEESSVEFSAETMVKRCLEEIKRTTIKMTEKTLNNLKSIVTKHFDLDPNKTLDNLIKFELKKANKNKEIIFEEK